jgi:hypothetical protein
LPPEYTALSSFEQAKALMGARQAFDRTRQSKLARFVLFVALGVIPLTIFTVVSHIFHLDFPAALLLFIGSLVISMFATRNVEMHYLPPHIQNYLDETKRNPDVWPNRVNSMQELGQELRARWKRDGGVYYLMILGAVVSAAMISVLLLPDAPWYVIYSGVFTIAFLSEKVFSFMWNRIHGKG